MDIRDTLRLIHRVSWTSSRPGLDRIRALLNKMGDPQAALRFIHIAGTNGKGSTAAMLAAVLQSAGYKTGLYTSPYIESFNERMRVNGACVSDAELIELVSEITPCLDALQEAPTEFDMVTAVAFLYFKHKQCDIVVLEAGLGGRLDSTNVIASPEAAVITSIGLDHTEFLGDTIEKIAVEKAEIIKSGSAVVLSSQSESVGEIVRDKCERVGASLTVTAPALLHLDAAEVGCLQFDYRARQALRLDLFGMYQLQNAAAALDTIDALQARGWAIPEDAIRTGLANVAWPGRFELMRRAPLVIMDGAHNVNGIAALAESLRLYFPAQKITFVMGALTDKDYGRMLTILAPLARRFIAVQPENKRALSSQALRAAILSVYNGEVIDAKRVQNGLNMALRLCGADEIVCVCGSLYMVGDVRAYFNK